jgi:hypothetical protein
MKNTEVVINLELHQSLQKPTADLRKLRHLVEEVQKWQVPIEKKILSFNASKKIDALIEQFSTFKNKAQLLADIGEVLRLVELIELDPSLNKLQNQLLQISRECAEDWSKSKNPEKVEIWKTLQKLASKVELEITDKLQITRQ